MKRGAKRPALFDSADPALRSKRVMDAPSFDVHRAESSRQHLMAVPPLDVQRAESACQHVRALNTQFASWVQSQLQHHLDELWEDGVKDYLSHASDIMYKFEDVVNWLKANATKGGASTAGSPISHDKMAPVSENNSFKLHPDASNGLPQVGKPASFASLQTSDLFSTSHGSGAFTQTSNLFSTSHGSGAFTINPTTGFTGNQSSTPPIVEASVDTDDENELQKPSSPSLKRTEEEGIVVVHEVKCKVYLKPDNPAEKGWKDMGMGQLSIKCIAGAGKATKDSKPIVLIRNDVGKILLNALLYPGIKVNTQKNTVTTIFHTTGSGQANGIESGKSDIAVARTYLLRLKTEEDTTKLAAAIKEYAPTA